jgi:2-iminobutanoate/2-iminopropanoate deaminase
MSTLLEPVLSSDAPNPIGPYSQAIKANGMLFCSGQIALDPVTGALKNANIEIETTQVVKNLIAVLSAAGLSFANVVKTTIFLTDFSDFAKVNATYESLIGTARPARSTVEVSRLPKEAHIEIECIAAFG